MSYMTIKVRESKKNEKDARMSQPWGDNDLVATEDELARMDKEDPESAYLMRAMQYLRKDLRYVYDLNEEKHLIDRLLNLYDNGVDYKTAVRRIINNDNKLTNRLRLTPAESCKHSEKRTVQPPSYDVYTYDELSDESKKSEGGSIRDTKCVRCGDSPAMYKLDGCSGNFCLSCAKELHWECPKELKDKKTAGKKESMERCDSCGAVMTEYDYDRYGGLCKHCRDKGEAKKSEDASSVDDLLARHNQKWLVKVSYDVDASHSAVAPSIVRADTKDAATNIALKRHRGLGYNMKVVSVEPMTESRKKSEGIGDMIDAQLDYTMFMRMCKTAAYLEEDEDYWDALWEYYSELGNIGDALVFFDNLFQYTAWCDADEVYDEYLDDKFKDNSKSKEECIDAAIDDGDLQAYKHEKGNYLVIL